MICLQWLYTLEPFQPFEEPPISHYLTGWKSSPAGLSISSCRGTRRAGEEERIPANRLLPWSHLLGEATFTWVHQTQAHEHTPLNTPGTHTRTHETSSGWTCWEENASHSKNITRGPESTWERERERCSGRYEEVSKVTFFHPPSQIPPAHHHSACKFYFIRNRGEGVNQGSFDNPPPREIMSDLCI